MCTLRPFHWLAASALRILSGPCERYHHIDFTLSNHVMRLTDETKMQPRKTVAGVAALHICMKTHTGLRKIAEESTDKIKHLVAKILLVLQLYRCTGIL